MTLSGILEIDYQILSFLSDHDLLTISYVSKYFYELCSEEYLWKRRLPLTYILKYPSLTWKEWYFFWKKEGSNINHLIEGKRLTSVQGYIFLKSLQGDLLPEIDIFQTIDLHLIKAMKKRDDSVESLIKKYYYLYDELYQKEKDIFPFDIICHSDIAACALECNYNEIAEQVTTMLITSIERCHSNSRYILSFIAELAKIGAREFYCRRIKPLPYSDDQSFLEWLIAYRHNAEVKIFYEEAKIKWDKRYLLIAKENTELVQYFRSKALLPRIKYTIKDYVKKEKKCEEIAHVDDDDDTSYYMCDGVVVGQTEHWKLANTAYKPNISKERFDKIFVDEFNKTGYSKMELIGAIIPPSRFKWLFEQQKTRCNIYFLIKIALESRNYLALFLSFDYDDKSLFDKSLWEELFYWIIRIPNKCLYVYIISFFAKNYPDNYRNIITNTANGYDYRINYEFYLLNKKLLTIPNEDIIRINIYDLLSTIYISN